MKIAYCLHGCIGGLTGKNGEKTKGSDIVFAESIKHLFNNLDTSNIDFFIHSWDTNLHGTFESTIKPKKLVTETQLVFDIPNHLPNNLRVQSHYSRWYSAKQVLSLKSQYETEFNFKYDLVILTRFDICWLKEFNFESIDTNFIHFDWCTVNGNMYGGINASEFADRIISANSENIDQFKTMYDRLSEYTLPNQCPQYSSISSHFCIPWHLNKLNLKSLSKFSFHYYGGPGNNDVRKESDFTIYRHF